MFYWEKSLNARTPIGHQPDTKPDTEKSSVSHELEAFQGTAENELGHKTGHRTDNK